MLISKAQQNFYWQLWGEACRVQKWNVQDRERRLEAHRAAIGSAKSLTVIEPLEEFGLVKAHLLRLADSVEGAMEEGRPELDRGRRWRYMVRQQYKLLDALGLDGEKYAEQIMWDAFRTRDLDDLTATRPRGKLRCQLERLIFTLGGRIDGKRREMGWSVHLLCSKAGVDCPKGCAQCRAGVKVEEPF